MNARRKNHIRSDAATLFPQPVRRRKRRDLTQTLGRRPPFGAPLWSSILSCKRRLATCPASIVFTHIFSISVRLRACPCSRGAHRYMLFHISSLFVKIGLKSPEKIKQSLGDGLDVAKGWVGIGRLGGNQNQNLRRPRKIAEIMARMIDSGGVLDQTNQNNQSTWGDEQ